MSGRNIWGYINSKQTCKLGKHCLLVVWVVAYLHVRQLHVFKTNFVSPIGLTKIIMLQTAFNKPVVFYFLFTRLITLLMLKLTDYCFCFRGGLKQWFKTMHLIEVCMLYRLCVQIIISISVRLILVILFLRCLPARLKRAIHILLSLYCIYSNLEKSRTMYTRYYFGNSKLHLIYRYI